MDTTPETNHDIPAQPTTTPELSTDEPADLAPPNTEDLAETNPEDLAPTKLKRHGIRKRRDWETPFLALLAKSGSSKTAYEGAGVSHARVYHYRSVDPRFARKWDAALQRWQLGLAARAEAAAIKRGIEGWMEPVFQGGQLVGEKPRYSDTLLVKVLEANHPKYTPKSQLELSGRDGGAVQVEAKTLAISVDAADLELVRQLLAGGMLGLPAVPAPAPGEVE